MKAKVTTRDKQPSTMLLLHVNSELQYANRLILTTQNKQHFVLALP
jgi:hypothetical protein